MNLSNFFKHGETKPEHIIEAITAKIKNDLDVDIVIDEHEFSTSGIENTFQISTSRIGPMALMIDFLEVTIRSSMSSEDKRFGIIYKFSYKHTKGGSNGYDIQSIYDFDGNKLR